jgi:amino acid transporter
VHNKFGFFSLVLLGINLIIGSGIFLLPNAVASLAGNASLWVILICTGLALVLALCFAEMGSLFSRNGGPYLYARAAFGEFVGFEVGLMRWVIVITSWAALTAAFAQVLAVSVPALDGPVASKVVICLTFLTLAMVNIRGVDLAKYVNNISTIGKLLPMAFLILVGMLFVEPAKIVPAAPNWEDGSFADATLIMFYAFTGFGALAIAAGDIENPRKNVPRALLVVIAVVACVYLSVQLVVTGLLGVENLAASKAPLADAAQVFAGEFGYQLIMLGSILSIFGITVSVSFVAPRLGVALAEDRLLPPFLARMGRFGTPTWSILIVTALALPLALSGTFAKIAAINVIARLTTYIPVCLGVLVLRRTMADQYTGFRIPFGPLVPLLGMAVCIWLLFNSSAEKLVLGTGALFVGAFLYLFMRWRYGGQQDTN